MTATYSPLATLTAPDNIKRWTVEEYHQLSKLGLLLPEERTELIAGQITLIAAKGTPHVIALQLLALQVDEFLRDKPFFARAQDPIRLDDLSEPEPDLVIVRGEILTYTNHHPQPGDISLIVEVADTTLRQDCQIKDKLYAGAGIEDYWVVDLKHRKLHVFRKLTAQQYDKHLVLEESDRISPLAFPELDIAISSLFPPI